MLLVGIDPGVTTGFAVWDTQQRALLAVEGHGILQAMTQVQWLHAGGPLAAAGQVLVIFEDARNHRVRFGRNARKGARILQGVGSVKRDCAMWEEFLEREGIPYVTAKPRRRATKKDAELFRKITGWEHRTNEHGRDAAMFVFGITTTMAEALVSQWQRRTKK